MRLKMLMLSGSSAAKDASAVPSYHARVHPAADIRLPQRLFLVTTSG